MYDNSSHICTHIAMIDPKSEKVVAIFDSINEASMILDVNRKSISAAVRNGDSLNFGNVFSCGYLWDILHHSTKIDKTESDFHIARAKSNKSKRTYSKTNTY